MVESVPSQEILDIKEIRDGVLILKDGSIRAVLMGSSVNFALKSEDEQNAIIANYQNFLNAVDFSVQFFIQSRFLNIEPYLDTLKEREKKQTNELLHIQLTEYIDFVRTFVRAANIVTKNFYIVIPFTPPAFKKPSEGIGNMLSGIFSGSKENKNKELTAETFEEYKNQLWQRVDAVIQGIVRTGVRTVPLNTEELIELFYGLYNPGELEKGKPPPLEKQTK